MRRAAIDNEKGRVFGPRQKTFEEFDEDSGVDPAAPAIRKAAMASMQTNACLLPEAPRLEDQNVSRETSQPAPRTNKGYSTPDERDDIMMEIPTLLDNTRQLDAIVIREKTEKPFRLGQCNSIAFSTA